MDGGVELRSLRLARYLDEFQDRLCLAYPPRASLVDSARRRFLRVGGDGHLSARPGSSVSLDTHGDRRRILHFDAGRRSIDGVFCTRQRKGCLTR